MYKRTTMNSWLKHWDFLLLDMIILQGTYILAYIMRQGVMNPYADPLYRTTAIIVGLLNITIAFFMNSYSGVLRRGFWRELKATVKHVCLIYAGVLLYFFASQTSQYYSRIFMVYFPILSIAWIYLGRMILKIYILTRRQRVAGGSRSLMLVVDKDNCQSVIQRVKRNSYGMFELHGVLVADAEPGETLQTEDIAVVSDQMQMLEFVKVNWVDEVLICLDRDTVLDDEVIDQLLMMGVTVHVEIPQIYDSMSNQMVENVFGYTVLSSSIRVVTNRQMFIKRLLDIIGGLIGIMLTGLALIFIGPIIFLKSPGPVFFSQVRVGRNGKRFKVYKFRSMYLDAEERKKELMERNEMQGLMFKLEADPRIIGSGPDGTRKGIGYFIRKYSIDELPQFWNVLKGDMSLIGTRPPTVDEWEKYEYHHRTRLAIKPGISGLWQVSGRSDITDFEEVVKLDIQYIKEWSLELDVMLILKTIVVVFRGKGAK